jgi:hypothetical protein
MMRGLDYDPVALTMLAFCVAAVSFLHEGLYQFAHDLRLGMAAQRR